MRASRLVVYAALCASAWGWKPVARAQSVVPTPSVEARERSVEAKAETASASHAPAVAPSAEPSPEEGAVPPRRTLWDFVKVLPIFFYSPETSAGFGAG